MNTENNNPVSESTTSDAVVNKNAAVPAKPEQNDSESLVKPSIEEQTKITPENNTESKVTPQPEQPTQNGAETTDEVKSDSTANNDSEAKKPEYSEKEKPNVPVVPEPTPQKLNDVLLGEGTNIVYISGTIGGQDFDCAGPIEMPFKFTQPMWPYTPVKPNPEYKNQTFDYTSGQWIPTDAKSQGQILTDLNKKVAKLESSNKVAEQTQKATMQTTMLLGQLMNKVDTLTDKIDAVNNDKKEVVKND